MSPVKNSHFQLNKSYLFTFLHLFVLQAASYNPLYEVYYTIFFGKGKLKYKESYVPPQSPLNSILRLSTASASLEPGLNETVPFVIWDTFYILNTLRRNFSHKEYSDQQN